MISNKEIFELRAATGVGVMDCKSALLESNGDVDKAKIILRKKGLSDISDRANKQTLEGQVGFYIHTGGRIGVLLEVDCETDFVAKSADFQAFVRNVSMHIAAANPKWISRTDVPQDTIDNEKQIVSSDIANKPVNVIEKIVIGRLDKFFKEKCLLEQIYVKDHNLSINDLLCDMVAKIGEKIVIKRFSRFEIGVD